MPADYNTLQTALNYKFSNPELLRRALTHSSAQKPNNERLEFLGDSLLDLVVSEKLYGDFPDANEGDLSRIRANFVNKDSLLKIARHYQLEEFILISSGERKSGGGPRESTLANAVEAIIAAIYLDGGLQACQDFIHSWPLQPQAIAKDNKTTLQELMQSKGLEVPQYQVLETTGAPHEQVFHVECRIALLDSATQGSGASKQKAEQDAAGKVLARLDIAHD